MNKRKDGEMDLLAYVEQRITEKLGILSSVAQDLRMIADLGLYRKEASNFQEYCLEWGLDEALIENILATPSLFKDVGDVIDFRKFAKPELVRPFLNLDRDDRRKLALHVVAKGEPITPGLIEEMKAKLFSDIVVC
jgi:hypothetical protein